MAPAVENTNSSFVTSTSLTYSITPAGTNRLVFVGVGYSSPTITISGVTCGGSAMTEAWNAVNNGIRYAGFYIVAPAASAQDVVVTVSSSVTIMSTAVALSGVHQSTPIGTPATAFAPGAGNGPVTVDVSSLSEELVIDAGFVGATLAPVPSVGSGQTSRTTAYDSAASGDWLGTSTEPGAATVTMSWTLNVTPKQWNTGAVAIKPSPAGTPVNLGLVDDINADQVRIMAG